MEQDSVCNTQFAEVQSKIKVDKVAFAKSTEELQLLSIQWKPGMGTAQTQQESTLQANPTSPKTQGGA